MTKTRKEFRLRGSGLELSPEGMLQDENGIMEQWNDGVKSEKPLNS
jgi:hypothetical protein